MALRRLEDPTCIVFSSFLFFPRDKEAGLK